MDPLTAIDIEALNELAATVIEERRRLAEHEFYDENSQRDRVVMSTVRFQQALVEAWPALLARLGEAETDAKVRRIAHPCPICDGAGRRRRARAWEQVPS